MRYYLTMIQSFKCKLTQTLAEGKRVKQFVHFEGTARRKLRQLEIANTIQDLNVPPGNRLESLKGDRIGQYSIRINNQWRICFQWGSSGPEEVEIVDYH